MKIVRFIFPFLFIRNWHDGSWELSSMRLFLLGAFVLVLVFGMLAIHILQAPVTYSSSSTTHI